ncbi:MAG TPA: nuclear transport factor 2 family protein [Pseudomonadales bacterium]
MSNIERFQAYAAAFEQTYADDDWQRLAQYFSADAVYAPGDGTEVAGRNQVLNRLRDGVNGLDRRFDSRTLVATPPTAEGDKVSLSWQLTLRKAGAPDLTATGVEHASYSNGVISRLEDVFDAGTVQGLGDWMAAHGKLLGG